MFACEISTCISSLFFIRKWPSKGIVSVKSKLLTKKSLSKQVILSKFLFIRAFPSVEDIKTGGLSFSGEKMSSCSKPKNQKLRETLVQVLSRSFQIKAPTIVAKCLMNSGNCAVFISRFIQFMSRWTWLRKTSSTSWIARNTMKTEWTNQHDYHVQVGLEFCYGKPSGAVRNTSGIKPGTDIRITTSPATTGLDKLFTEYSKGVLNILQYFCMTFSRNEDCHAYTKELVILWNLTRT